MSITFTEIGTINTPHHTIENMPIQSVGARGIEGIITLKDEYTPGLQDIDGFSHLILLYKFHEIDGHQLHVTPFMDTVEHGIFATRSPKRPSPIGISFVRLKYVDGNKLYFDGADMLNETPIIDIKPYFKHSDSFPDAQCGWLESKKISIAQTTRSDGRFQKEK